MDLKQFVEDVLEKLNSIERRLRKIALFLAPVVRHVRIAAPSWAKGGSAPGEGFVGIFPVLQFSPILKDEAHYSILVPFRMAAGSIIEVNVDWCYTGGNDAGTVCWKLEYKSIEAGEALVGGTTTIAATSPGGHTSGQMVRTVLLVGITGAVAHDVLGLRLFRESGDDTLATDAEMIQLHLMFIMDKLGLPI